MMLMRLLFVFLLLHHAGCNWDRPVYSGKNNNREEVVFWHFWGGDDRVVVESACDQFNESQSHYSVRPIAIPGNNLNAKLFLSVAGGDPPDLINQDDPVLADWAERRLIQSIDSLMSPEESERMLSWLFPAAKSLSTYENQFFGICNGLDIRAIYYNQTKLEQAGLEPPKTIDELDTIAAYFAKANRHDSSLPMGFLPDTRRLWAWSYVFGGSFFDQTTRQPTIDHVANIAALRWIVEHYQRVGIDHAIAFRSGDQSLPGKTFPLLPAQQDQDVGRYVMMMDGQWRVRDINRFLTERSSNNLPTPQFGVCPLPMPTDDSLSPRKNAGWVNGNYFVVPKGANNPTGAWAFIKFWIGFENPSIAAKTCEAGGWIPVSPSVVQTKSFQQYLTREPLFETFVELASSPNQFPLPKTPVASLMQRYVNATAYEASTHPNRDPAQLLKAAQQQVQMALDRVHEVNK